MSNTVIIRGVVLLADQTNHSGTAVSIAAANVPTAKTLIAVLGCLFLVFWLFRRTNSISRTLLLMIGVVSIVGLVSADLSVITDQSGFYELTQARNEPFEPGMYVVSFSHQGYYPTDISVEVIDNGNQIINVPLVILEPAPITTPTTTQTPSITPTATPTLTPTQTATPTPIPEHLLMGMWTGEAQVEKQTFLQGGVFPATVAIAQSGNRVRGILDIEQNICILAEAFGYLFEGYIQDNELHIQLTDRMCGAGEPENLCYPAGTVQKVFSAVGHINSNEMTWDSVEVLAGVAYPPEVDIEIPFASLQVRFAGTAYSPDNQLIVGNWVGPCRMPMSVVYFLPLPMYGQNDMTVDTVDEEYALVEFNNEGNNIVPDHDDMILADTFKYRDSSKRFWFVQLHDMSSRWLYVGELSGNKLTGLVVFDHYDRPYYDDTIDPIDPFSTDLLDIAAIFNFTLNEDRQTKQEFATD